MRIQVINTILPCDQRLIGHTSLRYRSSVNLAALGRRQLVLGIALTADHKAAILHQCDLAGAVLHVVHLVPGLIAACFLRCQVLSVVVNIAVTVFALRQNTDTGRHRQQVAFSGVVSGHVEIFCGVRGITIHDPLIIGQLVIIIGCEHQQIDLFYLFSINSILTVAIVCLLMKVVDDRAVLGIFLGLQLS